MKPINHPMPVGDIYAAKYVTPGTRPLSPDEIIVRQIARQLKTGDADAIRTAAPVMAALISGPCWLVPSPPATAV